jgi:hypothetical protein
MKGLCPIVLRWYDEAVHREVLSVLSGIENQERERQVLPMPSLLILDISVCIVVDDDLWSKKIVQREWIQRMMMMMHYLTMTTIDVERHC